VTLSLRLNQVLNSVLDQSLKWTLKSGFKPKLRLTLVFSERELAFMFAICYRPSICRLSSVMLVRPTQVVQIFSNISVALGTLAIRWHSLKIPRRSSQGNPSAGGVKHMRGSQV